jgi:hypothetical protein
VTVVTLWNFFALHRDRADHLTPGTSSMKVTASPLPPRANDPETDHPIAHLTKREQDGLHACSKHSSQVELTNVFR